MFLNNFSFYIRASLAQIASKRKRKMDPIPCDRAFLQLIAESNQSFVEVESNDNRPMSRTYVLPDMQNVEFFEPPRQFYESRRPSQFHPLCCFLKASYFLNGQNKTELFHCVQNIDSSDDIGRDPLRMGLRHVKLSLGRVWDPVKSQMVFRENLTNNDYKRTVNKLLDAKCDFWNHTDDKVNKAFDDAQTQCVLRTSTLHERLSSENFVPRFSPLSDLQNLIISL